MAERPPVDSEPTRDAEQLERAVGTRVRRHRRAEREGRRSVWFGLGMFGLVGWSIALPALLGVSCGRYLDAHYPRAYSWTLALLLAGVLVGCVNTWYWVQQERGRE